MSSATQCPACGALIGTPVLAQHLGDAVCVALQQRVAVMTGLRKAGATWRTQAAAGVTFTWVPWSFDDVSHNGAGTCIAVKYKRHAPAWVVWVAEFTTLDAVERTLIIQHCLQHDAARRTADAMMRLGVLTNPAKRGMPAFVKLKSFFDGVLLTTGP